MNSCVDHGGTRTQCGTICRRLQMNLAACTGAENPYELSMSIGVAHFDPDRPVTLQELMKQADAELYEHKPQGPFRSLEGSSAVGGGARGEEPIRESRIDDARTSHRADHAKGVKVMQTGQTGRTEPRMTTNTVANLEAADEPSINETAVLRTSANTERASLQAAVGLRVKRSSSAIPW